MMPYTIAKTYSNLKAAHRQWRHPGHCSKVHGENWEFEITLGCNHLDAMNFVIDFGQLRPLRDALDNLFDHTLLIDFDDPQLSFFQAMEELGLARVNFMPSASAEGLAKFVAGLAHNIVQGLTNGRVVVVKVVCREDSKNTATYELCF